MGSQGYQKGGWSTGEMFTPQGGYTPPSDGPGGPPLSGEEAGQFGADAAGMFFPPAAWASSAIDFKNAAKYARQGEYKDMFGKIGMGALGILPWVGAWGKGAIKGTKLAKTLKNTKGLQNLNKMLPNINPGEVGKLGYKTHKLSKLGFKGDKWANVLDSTETPTGPSLGFDAPDVKTGLNMDTVHNAGLGLPSLDTDSLNFSNNFQGMGQQNLNYNLGDTLGDATSGISDAASNLTSGIGDAASNVGDTLSGAASGVGDAASNIGNTLGDATSGIGDALGNVGDKVKDAVTGSKYGGMRQLGGFIPSRNVVDEELHKKTLEWRSKRKGLIKTQKAHNITGATKRKQLKNLRKASFQGGGYYTGNPQVDMMMMQNQYIADNEEEDDVQYNPDLTEGTEENGKGFKGYAKMLNKVPSKYKDKAASWMRVYDGKGNRVQPGSFPMITPGMIRQNLKKNQWLRMRYDAWRDNKRDISLKSLLPKS